MAGRNQKISTRKGFFSAAAEQLKLVSTRPNIFGYVPHDKQISFHTSSARGRLFIGGNRSGKTVGGATEAIWWLTGLHPYLRIPDEPIRGRCVSVDFLNGVEKIVKPEVARWVPKSHLRGGSWDSAYSKELRTLYFENGSFLEFMSYDQDLDKFAGTSRHFIWFDEEPPKEIFTENLLRLLDTGGSWWITMTPVEGMTWIYDDVYIAARTDPNLHVVEVDTTQNPNINQMEIEILLSGMSADDKKARIEGRFVQVGGLIYKHFSDKNVIAPMIPPVEWLHFAGMDHGFNNPTAWLWAAVDSDGRMVVYDEHYKSGEIVKYHAEQVLIKDMEHKIIPAYRVGDPSIRNTDPITGTSVLIEYVDNGVPIVLGNNDVKAGIDRVAKLVGNGIEPTQLYITANCVNLIKEMSRYRWSTWATKKHNFDKNRKEEPHKKNDHAVDALRYMIASRPLLEDGSFPEKYDPQVGSRAIGPYTDLIDPGVTQQTMPSKSFDYTLGDDW